MILHLCKNKVILFCLSFILLYSIRLPAQIYYAHIADNSNIDASTSIIFNFSKTVQPGSDTRELAVAFHSMIYIDSNGNELGKIYFGTSEANAIQAEGWFNNESLAELGTFQWAGGSEKKARITVVLPSNCEGLILKISSIEDDLQMTVTVNEDTTSILRVDTYWHSGYVPLSNVIEEPASTDEPEWTPGNYFPTFPATDRIYVFPVKSELWNHAITWVGDYRINQTYRTMMALTLVGMQGIINRNKPRLYLNLSYENFFWVPYLKEQVSVVEYDLDPLSAINFLIKKYGSRFTGAVVYDPAVPETINLATMIAGLENRIILAPEQLSLPGLQNFTDITDLRQLVAAQGWDDSEESKYNIYKWVYDNLWGNLEHRIIGAISAGPPTSGQIDVDSYYPLSLASRDLYVALKIPALWLDPRNQLESELYNKFLDEAPSPIPVLGVSPDEVTSLSPISKHGDWCPALSWPNAPLDGGNVTLLSGIHPEIRLYQQNFDEKKIIATLGNDPVVTVWCSDGDNLHYQMNRGFSGPEWLWENVQQINLGWTTNPVLSNIAPVIWNYYIDTIDKTSLISGFSGGGYTHPRYMNDQQLQNYLNYTAGYLDKTGLKSVVADTRGGEGGWNERMAEKYYNGLKDTGFLGVYFGDTGWPWGEHFHYYNQPVPSVHQAYLLTLTNKDGIIDDIMSRDPDQIFIDLTGSVPWYWGRQAGDYYPWQSGTIIQDADGYNGKSLYFSINDPYLGTKVYGPFATLAPGKYEAVFHLKTSDNQPAQTFAKIFAGRTDFTNSTPEWQDIVIREISPADFTAANVYQDFKVEFELADFKDNVEFKLDQTDRTSDIFIDYIRVTRTESLSMPLFVPIFVVVTSPNPQPDNVKSFVDQIEKSGGVSLTPDEFLAALNPEYMITLANKYLGAGNQTVIQAQTELDNGEYFKSLLTCREALINVQDIKHEIIPVEFMLYQNYPNPFNPITTIQFQLPKQSNVKINIYDMLGRLISVLVDEDKPAGSYYIKFNGSNLASGIYFYQLITDSKIFTKKFVLLK